MSLEKSSESSDWAQVSIPAQSQNFRLNSWGCNGKPEKIFGLGFKSYHLLESGPCPAPKICPT